MIEQRMTFHLCKGSATFHLKMRDLRSPANFIIFLSPTSRRHKENFWRIRLRKRFMAGTTMYPHVYYTSCNFFKISLRGLSLSFVQSGSNLALFIIYCIGSLGGTFGLFLGMSLLTILEFLDFIFARICDLLQGLHSGNRHTGTIHAEF